MRGERLRWRSVFLAFDEALQRRHSREQYANASVHFASSEACPIKAQRGSRVVAPPHITQFSVQFSWYLGFGIEDVGPRAALASPVLRQATGNFSRSQVGEYKLQNLLSGQKTLKRPAPLRGKNLSLSLSRSSLQYAPKHTRTTDAPTPSAGVPIILHIIPPASPRPQLRPLWGVGFSGVSWQYTGTCCGQFAPGILHIRHTCGRGYTAELLLPLQLLSTAAESFHPEEHCSFAAGLSTLLFGVAVFTHLFFWGQILKVQLLLPRLGWGCPTLGGCCQRRSGWA